MAFARTETSILNHRKFVGIDPAAGWLWALGNAYCWDQLTDGFIPLDQVPRLMTWIPKRRLFAWADVLVRRHLWEVVRSPERTGEHDAARHAIDASLKARTVRHNASLTQGFLVHDWLDHNPSKARVLADRQAAQDRMKQRRASRRSGERTGERSENVQANTQAGSGARSGGRSRQDVDVDVDSPLPKGFPRHQATSVTLTPEMLNDCPDGQAGFCVKTEYLAALPADLRRQCKEHQP